ncbi:helix-turn-helix domain-containing protein [Micromonospora carbonacea]|uniref:Helix-turn-helix transcriptional regulator n=1 Tax=Micromonospora carbonacea TaxID=47853 RepID=A0A7H8XQR8_9ACTN|nr:helix-turn-helix transcriptional regulator [Micromonospora carbonacea]
MTAVRDDGCESLTNRPERLGECLRRFREHAGLSLSGLARKVNYSRGYLSKVETGRAPGNVQLAQRCDEALGTGGVLARLAQARDARPSRGAASADRTWDTSTGWQRQPRPDEPTTDHRPDAPLTRGELPIPSATAVAFMLALDEAHNALRAVARADLPPSARHDAANETLHNARVYAIRERLLVLGAAPLVAAAEVAFLRLIAIRDAIRAGARLDGADYHRVYHPFAEGLWAFRMALRADLGQSPLTPEELGRADWSDRERCRDCGERYRPSA